MSGYRVLFAGSDTFSVPILAGLLEAEWALPDETLLVGVLTQPDRLAGRGRRVTPNPVTRFARDRQIPILQPARLRDAGSIDSIAELAPSIIVVAAYGQLLPQRLLDLPERGCLNLHPSLLPRYRGPTPIPAAILHGDRTTGVSLMLLDKGMDTGPILDQTEADIRDGETAGELEERLAALSSELLRSNLSAWMMGDRIASPQDSNRATMSGLIKKEDAHLKWDLPATTLVRQILAYNPWPMAFARWNDQQLRILRAHEITGSTGRGRVAGVKDGGLAIGAGEGLVVAEELQLPGGRALPAQEIVRGHPAILDAVLV